jgi:hypothetical protein
MYVFFAPDQEFPTNEEVAQHFQEIFWLYAEDPELVEHFHSKVLVPFGRAYSKYLSNNEPKNYNPFAGGIFTKINGSSIWDLLLAYNHIPTFRLLLAVLVLWGFATTRQNDETWTTEKGEALEVQVFESEIFPFAKKFE